MKPNEISWEIKLIDKRLNKIKDEKRLLENKKQALIEKLSNHHTNEQPHATSSNLSTQDKVKLFSSLFKGRTDIHALRWENKSNKSGYSVACLNEWQRGICFKPRVKCGECQNRLFAPINEQVLYAHLSGNKTVGVYPLLPDNTCYFLAADFDKSHWKDDVSAFSKACSDMNIPYAVERSRSGNGAHVWIFFESAILASDARNLGFLLLDKAMEHDSKVSFESYDRLFPNQDIMPDGGFGNLIALPLQKGPRKQGNSEFVDYKFIPYSNQWVFLSSIEKLSESKLLKLLSQHDGNKHNKPQLKPWEIALPISKNSIDNCPEKITIVIANKIYMPINDLPDRLIARLKRLASFSNPVFFKKQSLRFSTNGIPRFICLAYFDQEYLVLPRGCLDDIKKLLKEQSVLIKFDDKRKTGKKLKNIKFQGELRAEQIKAVTQLTRYDTGVLHAPTAFGKTITAIGVIAKRKVNTLILVHTRQLVEQWQERLISFLADVDIGIIKGGKQKLSGQIDIATYQSLFNRKDNSVNPKVFNYGQIIIDECHHISAPNYEMILNEIHAKYVLGITATIQRQDGHQPIIFMNAGPIRHVVESDSKSSFEQQVIVSDLYFEPPEHLTSVERSPNISHVYTWLMENERRNKQIVLDVVTAVKNNRQPLILTERREHALILSQLVTEHDISNLVLRGGMKSQEQKNAKKVINTIQVLIATGKYIGEGFDLAKLDTLFLALPISWKGSLAQYVGRIHRQFAGKERVIVYDYVDQTLPMLQRMFNKREKGYEALGYTLSYKGKQELIQAKLNLSSQTQLSLVQNK